MTALQFLQDSRAHLDEPHKWMQGALESPVFGAVCSVGALRRTYVAIHGHRPMVDKDRNVNDWLEGDILAAATYLCEPLGLKDLPAAERFSAIANFNDRVSHDSVLKMWDRAIELAQADEEIQGISVADLIDELTPA